MRVLVTGGAGYLGSHAAKALARAGHEPIVFDNFSTGHRWAVRWGPLFEGDLADPNAVAAAIHQHRPDAVLHFAASAHGGESLRAPRAYFRNNVANTLNLLDAMAEGGVRHIVFSSSCATYGTPRPAPLAEDHPQRPVNPYGDSKLFVERILRWFGRAYDLRWAVLRCANAAGADPDGDLGEDHDPETHLIPSAVEAALGRRPRLDIYGTDYPTPDGSAVRDFVHVADLADAHLRALAHVLGGGDCTAFNIGSGRGYSVRQAVAAVERVGDRPVPVRLRPRRPGDPPMVVADPARAAAILGWRPGYTTLTDIVATAWAWHAGRAVGGTAQLAGATRRPAAVPAGALHG